MKICSFLPSGTEIASLLEAEKELVGVTFECDYPPSVRSLPKVVNSRYDSKKLAPDEIDRLVRASLKKGESLYEVDENLLQKLDPDLILTQNLCQVCAPSGNEASQALKKLRPETEVLYLSPATLEQVFENIREVAAKLSRTELAAAKVAELKNRVAAVKARVRNQRPKEVVFLEWFDPPYCSGHWVSELVQIAGGTDPIARPGDDSAQIDWKYIVNFNPEILIVSPCGYHLKDTEVSFRKFAEGSEELKEMDCYRNGAIYAVDADAYFVRPGPRLVTGIEILAEIFHPEAAERLAPPEAYRRLTF